MSSLLKNSSLYGHALTSLPWTIWSACTQSKPLLYTIPDAGTAERCYLIFEKYTVTTQNPTGRLINASTNVLPAKYIELFFRYTVGTLLSTATALTALPAGIAIKLAHRAIARI